MNILMVSLGCDKNLCDSEAMLGLIREHKHNITNDENIKEFLNDVNRLVTALGELVHKFFKNDKIDGTVENKEGEE